MQQAAGRESTRQRQAEAGEEVDVKAAIDVVAHARPAQAPAGSRSRLRIEKPLRWKLADLKARLGRQRH